MKMQFKTVCKSNIEHIPVKELSIILAKHLVIILAVLLYSFSPLRLSASDNISHNYFPESLISDIPASSVSNTPASSISNTPASSVSKTPESPVSKTPESPARNTPESSISNAPESPVRSAPESSVRNTPESPVSSCLKIDPDQDSATTPDTSLTKLTFTPQWLPQAQFAGYYVALDRGFYKEAGLDVTIKHPSPDADIISLLSNKEADIVSAFLINGTKAISEGAPIVHFAQMLQHSSLMIVTRKESGIEEINQLDGRKLGIWSSGFDDVPFALFRREKIQPQIIRILNTVNLFLEGGVEAMTVMYYNEYNQILNSGVEPEELNSFFMKEAGFNIPEDALYCLETTWEEKKEQVEKFREATLKGWKYATDNKEYALDLVIQYIKKAHLPDNRVHQRWMLEQIISALDPSEKPVSKGELYKEDYKQVVSIINNSGE
jgi:NitT/TauT family transport system substrate-binding protein